MTDSTHYEQDGIWGEENVYLPDHQRQRFEMIDRLLPSGAIGVVEVGAGDGRVLHHLRGRSVPPGWMVAAERSQTALRHARTLRVQASADALPFRDRGAPAVLCCEVLEHLPAPVYEATRAELGRVADEVIVITVPNRENRQRAAIDCAQCQCRYNPDRHLRSFHPDDLSDLFPGFALETVSEGGPRQPLYPRPLRLGLERLGVLSRPGSPTCPQCGMPYQPRGRPTDGTSLVTGHRSARYHALRTAAPKVRHPYWLGARYRRLNGTGRPS